MRAVGLAQLPKRVQRALFAVAIALALGMVMCTYVAGAPRADSASECQVMSNIVVVARALALERIGRAKADAIMGRTFLPLTPEGAILIRLGTDLAFRTKLEPGPLGVKIAEMCLARRGNMDELLGVDS